MTDETATIDANTGAEAPRAKPNTPRKHLGAYLLCTAALTVGGLFAITEANRRYAPEMYEPTYMAGVAQAFARGDNYAVFDLNINIRKMREEQFKRMTTQPAITIMGASQWQEATANLIDKPGYFNAHIHRDYYEDIVGMVELMARHDRLPRDLVITIRDRMFTPVMQRTDFLWLPGIPYYQSGAKRLSLPPLTLQEQYPLQRPRELLSLGMLFTNMTRWHNADDVPYATNAGQHETLDTLNRDGSITWSLKHHAMFTQARSLKLSLAHAEANRSRPPVIDPKGVEAVDRVLAYLAVRGVRVHLAHPPFNPIYFDRVRDTPYLAGLREVETVTRELAAKHKLGLVGSFDPAVLGCTADMFIDAEHSNARCLRSLLADVARSIDRPAIPSATPGSLPMVERTPRVGGETDIASTWRAEERAAQALRVTPSVSAAPAATPAVTPSDSAPATPHEARSRPTALPPLPVASTPATPQASSALTPRPRGGSAKTVRKAATRATARKTKAVSTRPAQRANPSGPQLVWPGDAPRHYR